MTCEHPDKRAATAYRYGCRCDRCKAGNAADKRHASAKRNADPGDHMARTIRKNRTTIGRLAYALRVEQQARRDAEAAAKTWYARWLAERVARIPNKDAA